jgi:hypothetical protein
MVHPKKRGGSGGGDNSLTRTSDSENRSVDLEVGLAGGQEEEEFSNPLGMPRSSRCEPEPETTSPSPDSESSQDESCGSCHAWCCPNPWRPFFTPGKFARGCCGISGIISCGKCNGGMPDVMDMMVGRGVNGLAAYARENKGSGLNDSMQLLTPQEVHDRLSSRWSVQTTPLLLSAGINLSLSFGSEALALKEGFMRGHDSVEKTDEELLYNIFMFVSASAFILNMMSFAAFVRAIADLGRVPNNRKKMADYLSTCNLGVADHLAQQATLMTLLQVAMAFYGMSVLAFSGFMSTYAWCMFFMGYRTCDDRKSGRPQTRLEHLYSGKYPGKYDECDEL